MDKSIFWFRQDLRLADNPGLYKAAQRGKVIPIYILDDINADDLQMGAASRLWLHHSLVALDESLQGNLNIFAGDPLTIIPELCQKHAVKKVFWNRCYEPWRIQRDKKLKSTLDENEIQTESHNGSLLWEPWENLKSDKTPYKVFTPLYRKGCLSAVTPRQPLNKPKNLSTMKVSGSQTLADLNLLPELPWGDSLLKHWQVGELAAKNKLRTFLKDGLNHYKIGRDFPAKNFVSQLSPYLHFGEISPNQVWYQAKQKNEDKNLDHFLSELGWREFSYSLLYHFPKLPKKNLQEKFNQFPWRNNKTHLKAWQKGCTGYPIVDAGMRQLWQTGYMHNRIRMVVGSFLVKNLLLHWHHGEEWFWDCLVDADLANNSASWQWIAGCGADAAPYFRIFNPVTQGQKFDADGEYTLKYVPELKDIPKKYLFCPWEAPEDVLKSAKVVLGETYPKPVVDLKASRERALSAFESLKKS